MTGLEEAIKILVHTTEVAIVEYDKLPWWSVRERFIGKGSLFTLNIVLELLDRLRHKYDNRNGRLN